MTMTGKDIKNGFTLIELLIAMAIASILMAAVGSTYLIQVRGKNTQEVLTSMNQTARASMEIMVDEIRMAGCNPEGSKGSGRPRIISADAGEIIFSMDITDDAGTNQPDGDCCDADEVIRYILTNDADSDGVNDNVASGVECNLGRQTGPGNDGDSACGGVDPLRPLARNVDVLNFVYLDEDGDPIAAPVAANRLDDIRSVEVSIVARAGETSGGFLGPYTNTESYENLQGDVILAAQNDSFRRLGLSTTVFCRNMGQ